MTCGCTVTHLFVNMYLKSKLKHCCYLTVTVKLLLLVIYWWSCKQASYFTPGAQVVGVGWGGGAFVKGTAFLKFLWNISFALRHKNVILYIFITAEPTTGTTNVKPSCHVEC